MLWRHGGIQWRGILTEFCVGGRGIGVGWETSLVKRQPLLMLVRDAGCFGNFAVVEWPCLSICDVRGELHGQATDTRVFPLFCYEWIPHGAAHGMGTMHRPATTCMCSSDHGLQSLPTGTGPLSAEEVRGVTWGHSAGTLAGGQGVKVRNFPTCCVWLFLLSLRNAEQMPSRHAQGGQPQLLPKGLSSWLWESSQAWQNRGTGLPVAGSVF